MMRFIKNPVNLERVRKSAKRFSDKTHDKTKAALLLSKRCSDPIFRAVAREGMMRDHEHPSI